MIWASENVRLCLSITNSKQHFAKLELEVCNTNFISPNQINKSIRTLSYINDSNINVSPTEQQGVQEGQHCSKTDSELQTLKHSMFGQAEPASP